MSTFVNFALDDGNILLVQVDETKNSYGFEELSRDDRNIIVNAASKFDDALSSIRASSTKLIDLVKDLPIDEAEIEFGLTCIGEAGVFAIGKVGASANFTIKLVWNRELPAHTQER